MADSRWEGHQIAHNAVVILAIVWTAALAGSLLWNLAQVRSQTLDLAPKDLAPFAGRHETLEVAA